MASSKGAVPKLYSSTNQEKKKEVIRQLTERFESCIPLQIIQSVALNSKYNFENAIIILNQMSENVNNSEFKEVKKKNSKQTLTKSNTKQKHNAKYDSNADVIVESEIIVNGPSTCTPNKLTTNETYFENIIRRINDGSRVMILLRGVPGSGKSQLAKSIIERTTKMDHTLFVHSTDDFFTRNGYYHFVPSNLAMAHDWNQDRVGMKMKRGFSPIIVDNTNLQYWEMLPYVQMALQNGYFIDVLDSRTSWALNDKECARRCVHNVPRQKIKEMLDRYERNLTGNDLIRKCSGKYSRSPPVARSDPPFTKKPQPFLVDGKAGRHDDRQVDLMNFNDRPPETNILQPNPPQQHNDNNDTNSTKRRLSIDDIFKCNDKLEDDVLQATGPSRKQPSLEEDSCTQKSIAALYPTLDDVLSSWGTSEKAISSWNCVEKITNKTCDEIPSLPQRNSVTDDRAAKVDTNDIGTTTNTSALEHDENIKTLLATSRSITSDAICINQSPAKHHMLDKSTMIDDELDDATNSTTISDLGQLFILFPTVSKVNIIDLYVKCNCDLNWVGDILLDDAKEILPPSPTQQNASSPPETVRSIQTDPPEVHGNGPDVITTEEIFIKNSKDMIEEGLKIKKQLEECIDIAPEHYSPHLQQLKNWRHGKDVQETCASSPDVSQKSSVFELSHLNNECESDDYDLDCGEDGQFIELNLGESFVDQLELNFGNPELMYPKGFQPVVQVPVSLARQLHAFYLESIFQQMEAQKLVLETMIREDEEFAKKLQEKENGVKANDSNVPVRVHDLRDVIDMELAQKLHQQHVDEWKNAIPKDIAYKLTMQKLIAKFPLIEECVLVELLYAHNNCFDETVEAIKATGVGEAPAVQDNQGKNRSEPATPDKKVDAFHYTAADETECDVDGEELESARNYRCKANEHRALRAELCEKAQKAFCSGLTPVAQYYFEAAREQTRLYDLANNRAACAFLVEHNQKHKNASDTLDLHYLYVSEAIEALDIFIDRHINKLKSIKTKPYVHLMIITGRGNRSGDGRSRIKPAVIKRLNKRSLKFAEMNPGLLRITLFQHSKLTNDL